MLRHISASALVFVDPLCEQKENKDRVYYCINIDKPYQFYQHRRIINQLFSKTGVGNQVYEYDMVKERLEDRCGELT